MVYAALRLGHAPLLAFLVAGTLAHSAPALADNPAAAQKSAGPQLSSGVRRVELPSATAAKATPDTALGGPADKLRPDGKPAHQKGPAPRTPSATLPQGVPHPEPDARVRRRVALGTTAEERRAPAPDPELRALHEAEQTMFASRLRGVTPGWSWLPEPDQVGGGTEVSDTGLPPSVLERPQTDEGRQLAVDAEWLKSLAMPDLPVRMDERVVQYLKFYRDSEKGRAIAHVWAKKAGRYAPALRAEFSKAGLPKDLIWLSLIESGHNPTIRSSAGAVGLWQFIASSARMYGLTVDRWVDERLDPARSTQAAIRFLSDLYQRFGSWELAMAAYNMGYAGMSRAIQKFNTNDFWQLSRYEAGIPWETTLYVPKILAIAIVMNNKRAFGIDHVAPDPPEHFDTVLIAPGQSLSDVADAAKLSASQVQALNPQFLAGRTPPDKRHGPWRVRLPAGMGKAAAKELAERGKGPGFAAYRVRFGDTLQAIAEDHGTTEEVLAELNGIRAGERLRTGTILLMPKGLRAASSVGRRIVAVPPGKFQYAARDRVFYEVRQGDSLAAIASAFGVMQAELAAWNGLDAEARLQPGMVFQVFVDKGRSLDDVRHIVEQEAMVLVTGTQEFYEHHEALNGRTRLVITCKQGDTLASVGKRYGMSVGSMERVNRRSRRDPLSAGDKLVVYAARASVPSAASGTEPVALGSATAPHPELLPEVPDGTTGGSGGAGISGALRSLD